VNATDMAMNIIHFVPLVLFIHFYFKQFLKVNTLYYIITNVLLCDTCTSILHPCTL
jgi:hypothetical protein